MPAGLARGGAVASGYPAMTRVDGAPGVIAGRGVWGAPAIWLVLFSFLVGGPMAGAAVQPISGPSTNVAAGNPFDMTGSGFTLDAQALVWGGGPDIVAGAALPAVNQVFSRAYALAVQGNYAYVAYGLSGLQAMYIGPSGSSSPCSNQTSPCIVGALATTDGVASGIAVSGNYVYLATGTNTLYVIDVANPQVPVLSAQVSMPGPVNDVTVSGNYAYVAVDAGAGLQVVDITDPASPAVKGSVQTQGGGQSVAVAGNTAYVAEGLTGLQVVDISQPATPKAEGTAHTADFAWHVAVPVEGTYAYVADRAAGLAVVDVSTPSAPAVVASLDTPSQARGISVPAGGTTAYVADNVGGLEFIDITSPTDPRLLSSLPIPWLAEDVVVDATQNRAYVAAGESGLQVADVSNATTSMIMSSWPSPPTGRIPAPSADRFASAVDVAGTTAYVADHTQGLQMIDVSNPAAPAAGDHVASPDLALGVTTVTVGGTNNALVAARYQGVQVDNVAASPPSALAAVDTPGTAKRIDVLKDSNGDCQLISGSCYAYVADGKGGLQILDLTNPAAPRIIGAADTLLDAQAVRVVQVPASPAPRYYAFVAEGTAGVQVLDVTDPRNPVALNQGSFPVPSNTTAPFPGPATDIAIVRDPANGNQCRQVAGHCYAYIAAGKDGLRIQDLNPALNADFNLVRVPITVQTVATPRAASTVAISSDFSFAFVGYVNGVALIDIADPTAAAAPCTAGTGVTAIQLCTVSTPAPPQDLALAGGNLYVADGSYGLLVMPVFLNTTYVSGTDLQATAPDLPTGQYTLFVRNPPDGTLYEGDRVLNLTNTVKVATVTLAQSPQPAVTAQSSGTGKLLASGPGGQSPVGEATSPSQVDTGSGSGGGALGAGFMALLLTGLWRRARRRA